MSYRVELLPAAERALGKLEPAIQHRLVTAMRRLESDPMPFGARQLKGKSGARRIRVGDYRIVYVVHNDRLLVLVIRLGHRRDVYRAWALKRGRQG